MNNVLYNYTICIVLRAYTGFKCCIIKLNVFTLSIFHMLYMCFIRHVDFQNNCKSKNNKKNYWNTIHAFLPRKTIAPPFFFTYTVLYTNFYWLKKTSAFQYLTRLENHKRVVPSAYFSIYMCYISHTNCFLTYLNKIKIIK